LRNAKVHENFLYFGNPEDSEPYIFIRNCYYHLCEVIFDETIKKLRITGNPGIGKTFLGYYLFHLLTSKGKVVVYHKVGHPPLLFNEKIIFGESLFSFLEHLCNPDTWYIVDGHHPDTYDAKTILLCSPQKNHYKDFDKVEGGIEVRYMPVWDLDEIKKCRNMIHNNLEENYVKNLFLKWGGIPRFVLDLAKNENEQNKLQDAINVCEEYIFKYIGQSESHKDISHMLIHITTNIPIEDDGIKLDGDEEEVFEEKKPYTQKIIKFASRYVSDMVIDKVRVTIKDKLQLESTIALSGEKSNQFLGKCFEQICHRMLRGNGTFNYRSLESNEAFISYPGTQQNETLTFSEIDAIEDGKYFQPSSETFPSLDSLIAPRDIFQMTTSLNHPIKISGLKKVYSKISKEGYINYYFVVPNYLYNSFKKQIFTSKGKKFKGSSKYIDRIKQYVLEIDLDSEVFGKFYP
jgi:hypothetical protein